jgi:hypothetical protein
MQEKLGWMAVSKNFGLLHGKFLVILPGKNWAVRSDNSTIVGFWGAEPIRFGDLNRLSVFYQSANELCRDIIGFYSPLFIHSVPDIAFASAYKIHSQRIHQKVNMLIADMPPPYPIAPALDARG